MKLKSENTKSIIHNYIPCLLKVRHDIFQIVRHDIFQIVFFSNCNHQWAFPSEITLDLIDYATLYEELYDFQL